MSAEEKESKHVYKILISSRARKEIISLLDWYNERQAGLGLRLYTELYFKLNNIQANPEQYAVRSKGYREVLVHDFPLLVIYKVNKKTKVVLVVSVFHTSRNFKKKY